jgi:AraC family transcriptional regulator, regulatory protein of adaptative response / DNA-3-methyladenine glycosylase II
MNAVPRLAYAAAHRIGAGALNGHSVAELASELGVSERHLRRALEREIGVSPVELAQTHRLLLAKRLLADTNLSVTRVAFAAGFQSLRRFNTAFRDRYRLSPSDLRKARRSNNVREPRGPRLPAVSSSSDLVRLNLSYRAPFAWNDLLAVLARHSTPGVEKIERGRYARTVRLDGQRGVVFVEDAGSSSRRGGRIVPTHLNVDVSPSLVPVLMPLLARLRQLFDLDSEPTAIDSHLSKSGLAALVAARPGLRIPGAFDGFDVACRVLVRSCASRVATALGEPLETGIDGLTHIAPTADRIAEAGASRLDALGVPRRTADVVSTVARLYASRELKLEPGGDVTATHRALLDIGIREGLATTIVRRALYWPDAFPTSDRALQRAVGVVSAAALRAHAERWRPWRAYAALHLALHDASRARNVRVRSSRLHDESRRAFREPAHR